MVVFPAPSSPRMRILISRVPNKLEKMVEKKPPTKTRRDRHFNVSQLCGGYAKADRLTSFLTGLRDFSPVKKTSSGCCAQQHYVLLVYVAILWSCVSSLQQAAGAFLLQLQFFFFFSLICQNLSHLLFLLISDSTFSVPEIIQGPKEAWKNSVSDVYGLPQTTHLFFS